MTRDTDTPIQVGSVWVAQELRHMDDDFVWLQVVASDGDRITLDDHMKLSTGGVIRRADVRRTTMNVARLRHRFRQVQP